MRRLYYASGSLVVDDITCKAVLRYARALARNNVADVIEIPFEDDEGNVRHAHLLIGPASEIVTLPLGEPSTEPVDAEAVRHMEEQTRKLQPAIPQWDSEMTQVPSFLEHDSP